MSFARRNTALLAAGLAAAAAAFAAVALTTDGGPSAGGGGQSPAGGHVVAPARAAPASEPTAPTPAEPVPDGQAAGLAIFTRMGCGGCHRLAAAGSSGPIGPDLDERLAAHTRESLTAAILSPPRYAPMPDNFGDRMSDAELGSLVDFLLAVRRPR